MSQLENAVWVAHTLFERGKVAGSAANISFRNGGKVYISRSGSSFGILQDSDFSVMDLNGALLEGKPASKEYPLHLMLYRALPEMSAVLHTHSMYATLWSCFPQEEPGRPWPPYTPYLQMRVGNMGRIPYAKPGSAELFAKAEQSVNGCRAYLLENHGPIVAAKDIMSAFYDMEEIEESAKTAWLLRGTNARLIDGSCAYEAAHAS